MTNPEQSKDIMKATSENRGRELTADEREEGSKLLAEQAERSKKDFAQKQQAAEEAQAQQSQEQNDYDTVLSEITVLETGPDTTATVASEPVATEQPRQVEADKPAPKAASPAAPPPSIWKKIGNLFGGKG